MNRKSPARQLALFPAELPTWKSLSHQRQRDLQEVLSLLLEQMLQQPTDPTHDQQKHPTEKNHV